MLLWIKQLKRNFSWRGGFRLIPKQGEKIACNPCGSSLVKKELVFVVVYVRGRSAGSIREQRLVIEPISAVDPPLLSSSVLHQEFDPLFGFKRNMPFPNMGYHQMTPHCTMCYGPLYTRDIRLDGKMGRKNLLDIMPHCFALWCFTIYIVIQSTIDITTNS